MRSFKDSPRRAGELKTRIFFVDLLHDDMDGMDKWMDDGWMNDPNNE